jgi:RNA polymerase sigma factor (TIGR02999 family)
MGDSSNNGKEIDELLEAIRAGDEGAIDRLMTLVVGELRRLARASLKLAPRDQTLRTHDLVSETYVRMVSKPPRDWKNRAYFFGVAARTMRNILVDYERERSAKKRGRHLVIKGVELDDIRKPEERWQINGVDKTKKGWILDLNEALDRFEKVSETGARIVDMRYFGGMTVKEIAEVLNTKTEEVMELWEFAKAWLRREMKNEVRGS